MRVCSMCVIAVICTVGRISGELLVVHNESRIVFPFSIGDAEKGEKKISVLVSKSIGPRWHSQIRTECLKFRNQSMRSLCDRKIARDATITMMGSGARGFVEPHSAKRLQVPLAIPDILVRNQPAKAQLLCTPTCPSTINPPMSLSPTQLCTHEDPTRFPQFLRFNLCSCNGCINPKTGKEDVTFVSRAITVKVTVLRLTKSTAFDSCSIDAGSCVEELFPVPVGCHCVYPSRSDSP